jgi:diaminopimelate decarboxylase
MSKLNYEIPTINKLDFVMASKYGSPMKSQKVRTEIDGVSISSLISKFGSPIFVFSKKTDRRKV